MKKALLFALITSAIAISSCKKEKDDPSDATAVIVPQENDTIHGTGSFPVTGNIVSNVDLNGYTIRIYNSDADSVLYENTTAQQGRNFDVNQTVTHSLDTLTNLKMKLTLIAPNGQTAETEYPFFYAP